MNSWIEWFNATSAVWAERFWIATWQAVIVIAIAWLLTTLLRRLSPRVRSWIWRLAYVKILLSLFWTTPIELALLPAKVSGPGIQGSTAEPPASRKRQRPEELEQGSGFRVQGEGTELVRDAAPMASPSDLAAATPFASPQGSPPGAEINAPTAAPEPAATPLAWQSYLIAAWLFGLIAVIAWLVVDASRAWRLLRGSQPLEDEHWRSLSDDVCRRLGLRRGIRMRSSAAARSPVLVRFIRPAIILPQQMVATPPLPMGEGRGEGAREAETPFKLSGPAMKHPHRNPLPRGEGTAPLAQTDLALAIAHEAAHLRRHDLTWNALAAIVHVALYFHPLVWLAHRRIRLEQEMACDEMVLQKLSAAPHEYGRMLVNVVRRLAAV